MPYRLEKEKTEMTPYVLIDEEKRYMKLEGESYHANVCEFFKDINAWLATFLNNDIDRFTFDCQLQYFNSSTVNNDSLVRFIAL